MDSIFNPPVHAGAYDEFLIEALPRARTQRSWTPGDEAFPAIYLSHGAPPLFNDGQWQRQLFDWAQRRPKPKSILIVSAHWETAPLSLTATAAATPLVYDFGGFHPRYYAMKYPTPDVADLAARVAAVMPDGEPVHQHPSRGLDHGAWVPLMAMYPLADVPVLQMSMPTQNPDRLMKIGARLRELRSEGVLVVGSGYTTHGLPFLTREMLFGQVPAWSSDFDAWIADALSRGDVDALAAYTRAPGMPYAHPTPEHYIPIFVTLGAATDPTRPVTTTVDGYSTGFSKRSFETID